MLHLTKFMLLASALWLSASPGHGNPLAATTGTETLQEAYVKASNTNQADYFGKSVAISGDTAVVGAPREDSAASGVDGDQSDNNSPGSGAAYVFVRRGAGWIQQAYLKASNTGLDDGFGEQVAISGNTIVVAATRERSNASGVNGDQTDDSTGWAGAAYVFVRTGNTWNQQAYLKASNTEGTTHPFLDDIFGTSVAISGDTIVVGAYGESSAATGVNGNQADNSEPAAGAAYVFVRSGTSWNQQAYLKASNAEGGPGLYGGDWFGGSVAVSGDTVVVGARNEASDATGVGGDQTNNLAPFSGAAYVFVRNGPQWAQQAYLKASNAEMGDAFGASVAVSENTLVVGAYGESSAATSVNGNQADNSAPSAGAAYVFVRDGASWTQEAYLKASNSGGASSSAYGDAFGLSVAVSGDTVIVGAENESSDATGVDGDQTSNQAPRSGAAYVFVRGATSWTQQAYLKASNAEAEDRFGTDVALSGGNLLVGAWGERSSATGVHGDQGDNSVVVAGAAYVFVSVLGTSYCSSLPNATGSAAELSASGCPGSSLVLTSAPVPATAGLFFFGAAPQAGAPFGDGLLCVVGGAIQRMQPPTQASAAGHQAQVIVDYAAPYASALTGTQYFQYWFRSGLATGAGHNTSNGLAIDF